MIKPVAISAERRELYLVARELMDPTDPKPMRPAVILEAAPSPMGRVRLVTRTRHLARGGVPHGRQPAERLHDAGVFSDEYTIDAALFTTAKVVYLGMLDEAAFEQVRAEFE